MRGDGVDPVEDLLNDRQMQCHNLNMALAERDREIQRLRDEVQKWRLKAEMAHETRATHDGRPL